LQTSLRQFAMPQPDTKTIIEVHLYRSGFSQYKTLAAKLAVLFRMMQTQVCTMLVASLMTKSMSRIVMFVLQLHGASMV